MLEIRLGRRRPFIHFYIHNQFMDYSIKAIISEVIGQSNVEVRILLDVKLNMTPSCHKMSMTPHALADVARNMEKMKIW